jgi:hypothetical protein
MTKYWRNEMSSPAGRPTNAGTQGLDRRVAEINRLWSSQERCRRALLGRLRRQQFWALLFGNPAYAASPNQSREVLENRRRKRAR